MPKQKVIEVVMNTSGLLHSTEQLGFSIGEKFIISTTCEDKLDELLSSIDTEHKVTRNIRRKWGTHGSIAQDLVAVIKIVDIEEKSVFKKTIRLLALLSEPIELLLTSQESTESRRYKEKVIDISKLLLQANDACDNVEFFKKIKRKITVILEQSVGSLLSESDCDVINDCLLVLKNILQNCANKPDKTSTLLRHVFESKLEKILFALATHEQQDHWSAVTIQLLWFLFRNHADALLQKTSNIYDIMEHFDTDTAIEMLEREMLKKLCLSDSAYSSIVHEDDDDATDRQREGGAGSKTNKSIHHKLGTRTSGSTDSNPSTDRHAKKNNSRIMIDETDIIEKCLMQFAVGFLRSAFSDLVGSLIRAELASPQKTTDTYYLGWMMTFFLKVAKKNEIVPFNMERFMNKDVFGFLVNDAVQCCTRLKELKQDMAFCSFTHRRLDLTVVTLYQMFDLFVSLKDDDLNSVYLDEVSKSLARMNGLRYLILLLLRNFDSQMQSTLYLQELIETNHLLMLLLDSWHAKQYLSQFDMISHVQMFSTYDIMSKYGTALETFSTNSDSLNNCILTMMYHVSGDCHKPHVLQQLPILKTFTSIWESQMPLADEFNDFMEYVMEMFFTRAQENPLQCAEMLVEIESAVPGRTEYTEFQTEDSFAAMWTDEDDQVIEARSTRLADEDIIVDDLMHHISNIDIDNESDLSAVQLDHRIHPVDDHARRMSLAGLRNMEYELQMARDNNMKTDLLKLKSADVANYLIQKSRDQGLGEHLKILQNALMDVAFVKLGIEETAEVTYEPVAKFCTLQQKPVPITFPSEIHQQAMDNLNFYALLHHLNLLNVTNVDAVFPVIPFEWTPQELLEKAKQFGDMDQGLVC